jgi:predicted RNase H-like HicB family nuclease
VKVSAVVSKVEGGWVAECEEVDLAGEGTTRDEALATLRAALEDYFHRAEAVAPPTDAPREAIEIVVVGEEP